MRPAYFLHPVSRRIADESQVSSPRRSMYAGWMRNRRLARAIADAGWGELRRQTAYKAQRARRTHIEANR